jgi:hypothetical protein
MVLEQIESVTRTARGIFKLKSRIRDIDEIIEEVITKKLPRG